MSAYLDKDGKFIHFTVNASMERDDYDNNASEFIVGGSVREVAEMVGYAAELHHWLMPYFYAIAIQFLYNTDYIGDTEREMLLTAIEHGEFDPLVDLFEEIDSGR